MSLSADRLQQWCAHLLEESPDFPPLETCLDVIPALDSLADLPAGTPVLVRGDTDVTFDDRGQIDDDARLRALIETLHFGYERGWIQVLYGHRGRDPQLSLQPVAEYLQKLLRDNGFHIPDIVVVGDWMDDATGDIGDAAAEAVRGAHRGQILMLENTRKYKLEQALWKAKPADLPTLADRLTRYANGIAAKIARVHINEGFAASNRDLSSTVVPVAMERVALGRYIGQEMRTHLRRTRLAELVIFSGLKIEKLDDLQMILARGQVKKVIAAGNLAMALRKADAELHGQAFEMGLAGDATIEKNKVYIPPARIEQAKGMLTRGRANGVEFILPIDFVLGDGSTVDSVPPGGAQFDVGPKTIALHEAKVKEFIDYHRHKSTSGKGAAVVFHNGVFGMFEKDEFAKGTRAFMHQLQKMTAAGVETYVGGGEGGAALHRYGDDTWVTHCFTAGGTILKALGTEPIPYIKALYLASKHA